MPNVAPMRSLLVALSVVAAVAALSCFARNDPRASDGCWPQSVIFVPPVCDGMELGARVDIPSNITPDQHSTLLLADVRCGLGERSNWRVHTLSPLVPVCRGIDLRDEGLFAAAGWDEL